MTHRAPRITAKQYTALLAAFIADTTAVQAVKQMIERDEDPVSKPCAIRYFRRWREIIRTHQESKYPRFTGEVEIDLGFFGGRGAKWTSAYVRKLTGLSAGRIVAKRKEIKKMAKKQPVLGILNRGGDVFLLPVKSKSAKHLIGAVRMVVEQGTVIYSDAEKGLGDLKFDGYIHRQINKARDGFVSPEGYHANGMESFWREARRGMSKNFRGIPRSTIDLHIKEREFRYNHRADLSQALKSLLANHQPHHQRHSRPSSKGKSSLPRRQIVPRKQLPTRRKYSKGTAQ